MTNGKVFNSNNNYYTDRYAKLPRVSVENLNSPSFEQEEDGLSLSEAWEFPQGSDSFSIDDGGMDLSSVESGQVQGMSRSDAQLLQEMAQEIKDLKEELGNRENLDATGAVEDTQDGLEEIPENNLLSYLQEKGQKGLDEKKLQNILKQNGFDKDKLKNLELPADADTSKRLLQLFQAVDPSFATQLSANPANPYQKAVVKKLSELLSVTLTIPTATDLESAAVGILDQSTEISWDGEKIKAQLSGVLDYAEGAEVNGRWLHCGKFIDQYLTPLADGTKTVKDLADYLAQGNNPTDHSGLNRAIEIRRAISAIYYASDRNPYLLRRYLKKLPDAALRLMKSYLEMDPTRKDVGDEWDGHSTAKIVDWVMKVADMPFEFGDLQEQAYKA